MIFLALFVCQSSLATVELRVGNSFALPGGTALLPVLFTTDSNVVAAQFDLLFGSTNVSSGDAAGGSALADHAVTSGVPAPDRSRVVVYSPANSSLASGVLITIPLTLASNTAYDSIPLTLTNVLLANYDGSLVTNTTLVLGSLSCTSNLPALPVFLAQPQSQTVVVGTDVRFTAIAAGEEPLTYQWQFNGTKLPGATTVTLSLTNVQPSGIGAYSMVVSNASGSVTSAIATVSIPIEQFYTAVSGSGQISISPSADMYYLGQKLVLTATPSRWYAFSGWSDGLATNPRTITIGLTNFYTAIFTATVPLEWWTNHLSGQTWEVPVGMPEIFVNSQPTFGGTFTFASTNPPTIDIQTSFLDGTIFYTLDGSDPLGGSIYDGRPIVVSNSVVLQAVAFDSGFAEVAQADPVNLNVIPVYWLTLRTNGPGAVTLDPPGGAYLSNTVVSLTAIPQPEWFFTGWIIDTGGAVTNRAEASTTVVMNQPTTVTAVFDALPKYWLNAGTAGGGSVSVTPTNNPYLSNTVVSLTAAANTNWSFLRWTGDASGTNPLLDVTMDRLRNIQAVFGTALTTTPLGGGTIQRLPGAGPYPYGSAVQLAAVPNAGNYLRFWGGAAGGNSNSPLSFVVTNANQTVTAIFAALPVSNYSLTILINGEGTVNRSLQASYYTNMTAVTLMATPANGWGFTGWTGDVASAQNPLGVLMTTSKTVTANFAVPQPPVITAQPQDVTVLRGSNAQFSVTAQGTLPLDYQWLFNGTNLLAAETNSILLRTNAQLADTGAYSVLVSNAYGSGTSSNAVLTVVVPNTPPFVSLASPTNGAMFTAPATVALSALAGDTNGTVVRVEFYSGAMLVGAVTNAQPGNFNAQLNWSNVLVGSYTLIARAVDNGGLTVTSAPVHLSVQTALPEIALTSPTNGAVFVTTNSVLLNAVASDADNSIARVDFYYQLPTTNSQPVSLGSVTNPPYHLTWTNPPPGLYALSGVAVDGFGPMVTSAPVNFTVISSVTTNPAVFQFSATNYPVNENAGSVALTVLNNGDVGGSVSFQTVNGTAHGGTGFSGDYTISSGNVSLNGHQATNISIQILDNYLDRPDIQFQVQLLFPSPGATLGSPATATVTIHENDLGGATNSLLVVALPSPQPRMNGQLTVNLAPPQAGGQWRFPWDLGWRTNGQTVVNLAPGDYPIVFRSLSNYLAYPPTVTVTVPNNGTAGWTNQYLPTLGPSGPSDTGSLTVNIGPNSPPGAGWRFLGETTWRAPGSTANYLLPDTYFIEFGSMANWSKPASQAVQVSGGASLTVLENYLSPASAAGFALPVPVAINNMTDYGNYPYGFNGQLQTDVGYGSGAAVRENIVLTAAHMVFNDQTLTFVKQAYWSFQEEAGVFQPEPLAARGWFMLSGYAAQRTNDLPPVGNLGPDQSSPRSRNLDVAALYFLSPAARTGYGGYLASDAVPNPWLTGSKPKMLVGYPVDGSFFGQVVQPGTLYVTPMQPDSRPFTLVTNQTYAGSWFLSYPGNSGGPVYVGVPYSGGSYYFPAAVYLGTLYSGGSYQSVVRAIDSTVVNLINLAASEGDTGTNNTGGGVITITAGAGSGLLAYVQVPIGPTNAVAAGAAWRVSGTTGWSTGATFTEAIVSGSSVTLEFKPIPGWNLPTNNSVQIALGALTVVSATYTPNPARMVVTPAGGLTASGYPGGPFSPAAITCTLSNSGAAELNWSVSKTANWLTLSVSSGTLAAGATTDVTVSVNANANNLAAGSYADTVAFTNLNNNLGNTAYLVSLLVSVPPVQFIGARRLANGAVTLTLQGVPGRVYSIVVSTNLLNPLSNWAEVLRLTNTGGQTVFTNPPPSSSPRYYRAKEL